MGCLLESGVAEQLASCRSELESQIRSLILATDINRQQEFLLQFRVTFSKDFYRVQKIKFFLCRNNWTKIPLI